MALDGITGALFRPPANARLTRVQDLAKQLQAATTPPAPTAKPADRYGYVQMDRGADGTVHHTIDLGNKDDVYAADTARQLANGLRSVANDRIERLKPIVERRDDSANELRWDEKEARRFLDDAAKMHDALRINAERGYAEQQVGVDEDGTPIVHRITGDELQRRQELLAYSAKRWEAIGQQSLDGLPKRWKEYEDKRKEAIRGTVEHLESSYGFKATGGWVDDPDGDHAFGDYSLSFTFGAVSSSNNRFTAGYTQTNGDPTLAWSATVNGQTTTANYSGAAALAFLTKPFESAELQKRYGRGSGPENHTGVDVAI